MDTDSRCEEVLEGNLQLASSADQREGSGTTRNSTNESKEQAKDSPPVQKSSRPRVGCPTGTPTI
ncbi:hypothetical protein GJ744_009885 [Endocarpon pusillum]|uniref:Uncharacterized protein n=1 Tax=Endocarpon pusillum TaxID=364733 RepID=A0A8H7E4M4_9EURO|nr:hypothetical protein GJ744_009885 [Endocarpon pusillum]